MPMNDGSMVFYEVWLPETLKAGEKIPAMVVTSRYTTHVQPGPLYKLLMTYGGEKDINFGSVNRFAERGYAYVFIQSPGSVGSTGVRQAEYPPAEIEAMGKVVDWIVRQEWSNKRVGSTGVSYSGTTADMIAATMRPGVKAVAPLYSDFDPYLHVVRPGGLFAQSFTQTWSDLVRGMDQDDLSGIVGDEWYMRYVVSGAQRPAGDDGRVFELAIQENENNVGVIDAVAALEFKDDTFGSSGYSMDDVALYAYKEELERAQVSAYYRVGWFDAGTVEGALQRYLTIRCRKNGRRALGLS
jgi:putative CocE/NonD family hydrolase